MIRLDFQDKIGFAYMAVGIPLSVITFLRSELKMPYSYFIIIIAISLIFALIVIFYYDRKKAGVEIKTLVFTKEEIKIKLHSKKQWSVFSSDRFSYMIFHDRIEFINKDTGNVYRAIKKHATDKKKWEELNNLLLELKGSIC